MACHVEIHEDVLNEIESWNLPPDVSSRMFATLLSDLQTRITTEIGPIYSAAPVRLWRYSLAVQEGTERLHNFVFLVNKCNDRRIVMGSSHRIGGAEF